jgi:hypothetical protein
LCPDPITFVPNIKDDEKMHFELQLVVLTRPCAERVLSADEASKYIIGYTLAIAAFIHPDDASSNVPIQGRFVPSVTDGLPLT